MTLRLDNNYFGTKHAFYFWFDNEIIMMLNQRTDITELDSLIVDNRYFTTNEKFVDWDSFEIKFNRL
jgi:hypothetical protein